MADAPRFDVQRARRSARARVAFLRFELAVLLGVLGGGYVVLGQVVLGRLSWASDHPVVVAALAAGALFLAARAFWAERSALMSCTTVARMLGAREVAAHAASPAEQTLRNVAEEVAVAAGVAAPRVYLLPGQPGINALAVGPDPARGGVFVSSSAAEELGRDALQAVVAHEIAHLVAGDAHLHAFSAGVLAALRTATAPLRALFLAPLHALFSRIATSESADDPGIVRFLVLSYGLLFLVFVVESAVTATPRGPAIALELAKALAVALTGLGVLGLVGTIIARSMDLAVSQETEFAADALAVELTRHPDSLAEALRAIRDSPLGGILISPAAARLRPFFFARADSAPPFLGTLFESHPPPDKRLHTLRVRTDAARWRVPDRRRSLRAADLPRPTHDPINDAARLLDALPDALREAAHTPALAEPLAYALLLSDSPARLRQQQRAVPPDQAERAVELHAALASLPASVRLPLLEIAVPALRRLGAPVRERLTAAADAVAAADGRVTVRETAICEVLHHALDARSSRHAPSSRQVLDASAALLSALACAGAPTPADQRRAFEAGAAVLRERVPGDLPDHAQPDRPRLRAALALLAAADATDRATVLDAARVTAWSDGRVLDGEADLVRAIALAIQQPVSLPHGPARHRVPAGLAQPELA